MHFRSRDMWKCTRFGEYCDHGKNRMSSDWKIMAYALKASIGVCNILVYRSHVMYHGSVPEVFHRCRKAGTVGGIPLGM